MKLPTTFLEAYDEFEKGSFVVNFKKTCVSTVLMHPAFEKAYNKPAKVQGGTIGFTRRKQAVAQFNLIGHEKERISSFLQSIYHLTIQDEYTLHHEFSDSITQGDS